jgi:hypothetical protein
MKSAIDEFLCNDHHKRKLPFVDVDEYRRSTTLVFLSDFLSSSILPSAEFWNRQVK